MSVLHIRQIYRRENLKTILACAQRAPGDAEGHVAFARFQRDMLQDAFGEFRLDGLLVTTSTTNSAFHPEQLQCVFLDVSPAILESYQASKVPDPFFPLVHRYPGRAIYNLGLMTDEDWRKNKLYTEHCSLFGIYRFLRIGVQYPGKDHHFVSLDYIAGEANDTWKDYEMAHFELASFPFHLAWLYRYNALDAHRLKTYFERLGDLSASQITYLRKYVNSPWQDLAAQAADLGYSLGGYKQSLYALRDAVHDRLKLPEQSDGNDTFKSLRILEYAYRFLTMLGDPVQPRMITLEG